MNHPLKLSVAVTLLAGSAIQSADASTVDALTLLGNYNLITSGNVTSSSEVDGNALIGGNVSGGMYNMHVISTAVPSLTVAGNLSGNVITKGKDLHVGGDVSGSVTMNDGGNAYVGSVSGSLTNNANGSGNTYVVGNIGGSVNTNGGNTVYGGTLSGSANANGGGSVKSEAVTRPFDPTVRASEAIATLSAFSTQLSGLAANSSYSFSGNRAIFNAAAGANGQAVFDITDASGFFSQASEFEFNLNGATSVLFNVSDSAADAANDLNIHANFLADSAPQLGSKMLWNFTNAKKITLANQFGGSLLALFADTTTSQNIEGTLVAKSLIQGAEIHSRPMDPNYPTAVPLPPAASLFGAALAAIGAVARRRSAKD